MKPIDHTYDICRVVTEMEMFIQYMVTENLEPIPGSRGSKVGEYSGQDTKCSSIHHA